MKLENYFNLKRFLYLVKNDLINNYRSYFVGLGAITGVIVALDIIMGLAGADFGIPVALFYFTYFLSGFIISSIAFNDMHHPQKGISFFTLPCSIFERLLSKFIITTVIYTIVILLYFIILNFALGIMNNILFSAGIDFQSDISLFGLFSDTDTFIFIVKLYFIVQSVFLFASTYFNKNAFLKLIFAMFVLQLGFSIYTALVGKMIFVGFETLHFKSMDVSFNEMKSFLMFLKDFGFFILNWVIAPYFWILTFLRLKEKEV